MSKGFVYFMQEGLDGKIKIGFSQDPRERLKTLQTSNPRPLRILHTLEGDTNLEDELKKRFKASKVISGGGTEWFEPTEDLLVYIEENKSGDSALARIEDKVLELKNEIVELKGENKELQKEISSFKKSNKEEFLVKKEFEDAFESIIDVSEEHWDVEMYGPQEFMLFPKIQIDEFTHIVFPKSHPKTGEIWFKGFVHHPFMHHWDTYKEPRYLGGTESFCILDFVNYLMADVIEAGDFYFSSGNPESQEYQNYLERLLDLTNDFAWKDEKPLEIVFRAQMNFPDNFILSRKHIGDDAEGAMQPGRLEEESRKKINSEIFRIRGEI